MKLTMVELEHSHISEPFVNSKELFLHTIYIIRMNVRFPFYADCILEPL